MGRRPPSEPGVMHLTTAAAVRMRAGRTDTRSAPEQPEAARHRPETSDSVATLSRSPRLVSSHLVSSAATRRYDHTTQECCRHQFLRPNDPRECYRHRLLASITGSRPILVSSVSPHLIVSSLFSALSSHLVQSPGFPTGQQCGPLHSREQPPSPLIVLRNDPRDRPQRCRPQRQNSCTAVETRSVLGDELRCGAPLELRLRPERIRAAHSAAARHMASYAEA